MALKELLSAGELDIEALKRIKHRVFVVGRFNQHNRTNYPDMYLFTNRPKDSLGKYAENFTNVQSMQYESFVKMLLPAISEKADRRGRINFVTQVIPEDPKAAEGSSVIDTFNFFFQRAVANSPQGHFAEGKPGLPNELLREGANERGKQIFQLIRQNLTVFSSFQPHTHEIVDAMSQLFSRCGRRRFGNSTMPDYAHGDALPAGFPEKLIDYLYAEDSRARFSAEGLEFTGPWAEVQRDETVKDHFCSVVTSFRDAMLDSAGQHGRLRFDGKTLDQHAAEVLNEYPFEPPRALKTSFQGARDAFNGLRQILRSKVLLSMVLEWLLLEGYDHIEDASGNKTENQRDRAIETAILERHKENKLAKPVQRASQEERDQFSQDLTNNFEFVVTAILADDKSLESKLAVLPGALRSMAEELRKDKTVRDTLAGVSGQEFGPEYQKSFVDSMKVVILDNLCPALFQLPILTVDELRKFFRQETRSAYLTAVFLATDGRDAVRKIAEDHLEYFQEQIDKTTQKIKDPAKIQQVLLRDVIGVLAQPEIKNRLMKGMRVLNEGHAVLQNGSVESVSAMVPIRPDPKLLKEDNETLRNTEIKTEAVTRPLEKIVASELTERVNVAIESARSRAAASGSTAGGSSAGGGAAAAGPAAEPSASPAAAASAAPVAARSEIEQNASSAIDDILNSLPPETEVAELKEDDITDLVNKATAELTNKPGFVQGVKNDLRAFEQALFMIYQRYNENFDKPTFRNRVERLTLVNLMLLFKKELGLGEVSSNLHHLLLDMVQHLDPKNPDLRKFLKEKSLTLYFDNAFIKDRGITNLRQTLRAQADESLSATVNFVSELRGIKYLMDLLKSDQKAEVVVVNATATEFINFLQADNLNDPRGRGRLRSGTLMKTDSEQAIAPGLVYLADLAFSDSGDKLSFLQGLADTGATNDRHRVLLPPICVSTRPFVRSDELLGEGTDLALAAAAAAAPVVIVGPSPFLTQRDDPFHAYLPAGYMFAAHFLCKPSQDIKIENVNVSNNGRFRVIGTPPRMRDRLETVICGEGLDDKYAFAVDFYLYIALTIIGTISARAVAASGAIDPDAIYKHFHKDFGGAPHAESAYLNDAMMLSATDFSMYAIDAAIAGAATGAPAGAPKGGGQAAKKPVTSRTRLSGVEFTQTGPNGKVTFNITDVQWFNRIRELWGHQLDLKEN